MMKRSLWIGGSLVAAVVATAGVGIVIDTVKTSQMVAIADHIQPEPGWKLTSENVSGGFFCVDVPCYSMHRTYQTQSILTEGDLKAFVAKSGLGLVTDGPCESKSGASGTQEMCGANAISGDYRVHVAVVSPYEGGPELVSVQIGRSS